MTSTEEANLAMVRAYLAALQAGSASELLREIFTQDIRQIELPNKLHPNGQESDLADMLKRCEQGVNVLREQRYEIVSEIAQGDRVAIEALWTGVLAVPFGAIAAGSTMKAHFAMFFEFRDGKIALQRNYDCFEAW
jgi:ketosteroid isomerase-like protein